MRAQDSDFVCLKNSMDARKKSHNIANDNLSCTYHGGSLGLKVWAKNKPGASYVQL